VEITFYETSVLEWFMSPRGTKPLGGFISTPFGFSIFSFSKRLRLFCFLIYDRRKLAYIPSNAVNKLLILCRKVNRNLKFPVFWLGRSKYSSGVG
jgi:hypothetical protein